jgi:putative copper resistance protein D
MSPRDLSLFQSPARKKYTEASIVEFSGWDVATLFVKAIAYAATLCSAGSVFFLSYGDAVLRSPERTSIRRWIGIFLTVSAIASIATIPLLAGSMSGDYAGMFDGAFAGMILRAGEGRATGIRLVGLAFAALSLSTRRDFRMPAIVGAIAAATSFAWIGHVHSLKPDTLPTLLLCVHLVCAAFWMGALPPLLLVARAGDAAQAASAAGRFGKSALIVVSVLLIAGGALLWMLIADASTFWSSGYGRLFAVKLLAVALLLGLAALNKLSLTPKLLNGDKAAARALRRSIKAEMFLGGSILLITAAFTTITGPP